MNSSEMPHEMKLVALVNRYATPLAVILVAMGIVLSQPLPAVRNMSVALLAFGIVFNLGFVYALERLGEYKSGLVKMRLAINLAVNVILVYLLGGYWQPIWLLLALTPMATAIYESKTKTLFVSAGVSAILLAIFATRGMNAPLDWGQQLAHAAFIILVSLMMNGLSQLARSQAAGANRGENSKP